MLKAGDNKEIIFELEAIEEAVPNKPFFTVEEAARVPPVDLVLEMLDGLLDLAVEAWGAGQG